MLDHKYKVMLLESNVTIIIVVMEQQPTCCSWCAKLCYLFFIDA